MSIESGVVGGSAGSLPVSMELLQLIAADPTEFQRRMALVEQSKKDFDAQLEKNQMVGDLFALRKESTEAVDKANAALESAKEAAALILSNAKDEANKLLASAKTKADGIEAKAVAAAEEQTNLAAAILSQAQAEADAVQAREKAAAAMMKDAKAKYSAIEPDRKLFQDGVIESQLAAEQATQAKADYEAKREALTAVAKQLVEALNGG